MLLTASVLPAAAVGTITISSADFTEGQTSYVMSEIGGKTFGFEFEKTEGTHDTVLVVECPEYGADWAAVPTVGDMVQEVVKLDTHRIAIRFQDSTALLHYFATFSLSHVRLTNAQAGDLISALTLVCLILFRRGRFRAKGDRIRERGVSSVKRQSP